MFLPRVFENNRAMKKCWLTLLGAVGICTVFAVRADDFLSLYTIRWGRDIDSRLVIQAQNKNSVSIVNVPNNDGVMMKSCINLNEDYSKVGGIPRAEVAFDYVPRFSLANEYEVNWSILIPENYQFDAAQPEIITQIHQSVNYGSPPFALMLSGNRYRVEIRGGAGTSYYAREFGGAEKDLNKTTFWKLRYRPSSTGANALIELYKNGVLVVHVANYPNAYPNEAKAYLKIGLYKWWWKSRPSDVTERCLYYGSVNVRAKRLN